MDSVERPDFGYMPGDDFGDGWSDATTADLEGFNTAVDPMYDSGIINDEPDESIYTPPANLSKPTERPVEPQIRKEPARRPGQRTQQSQARPPLPNHAGDKPLTVRRNTRAAGAAVIAVVALAGATPVIEAIGERPGIRSEIETDFRGENLLGQNTDKGCLDGTPYGGTEIHIEGVLTPGQTTATIESADPELPDLKFDSYGTGSDRSLEPADDYTNTFVQFHLCDDN
jgi:hypothetical protein